MQPSIHYDYSQEFEYTCQSEYPKKDIGRDPRVWSPNLLSHRLPVNTLSNNTHYPTTTTTTTTLINAHQTNNIPSPNEYDYPTTAQYPKKDIGRDPRVWSPNLLSHRLPNNQQHKHHTQLQQTQQSQQSQISLPPNNYYESFEYTGDLYPKKNIGRDPRVWSPNLLSHRLPNNTINGINAHSETPIQNQDYPPQLAEYEYTSQGAYYPKKDIGRDPRVWSPNLLSHRLPNVSDNTTKHTTETTTTLTTTATPTTTTPTTLTYTPNEFEYSRESEYPKKNIGRDPRVWSPNLLSHRIPSENSSKKRGEVVFPVRRYSRAKL